MKPETVTAEMLRRADEAAASIGCCSHYRRPALVHPLERQTWERENGRPMPDDFVAEEIALKVLGDRWIESRRTYRKAHPGELEQLQAQVRVDSWSQLYPNDLSVKYVRDELDGVLSRVMGRQTSVMRTVVCGAPEDEKARPCTEEQELRCEWAVRELVPTDSLLQRTAKRHKECPRRKEWENDPRHPANIRKRTSAANGRRLPLKFITEYIREGRELQERPALLAVREWAKSGTSYLVLCATNQSGKTFAACAWLESRRDKEGNPLGIFIDSSDLWESIRPTASEVHIDARRRARNTGHLILDNWESHSSDALRSEIDDLVRFIGNRQGRMIITTSMSRETFLKSLRTGDSETGAAYGRLKLYGTIVEINE